MLLILLSHVALVRYFLREKSIAFALFFSDFWLLWQHNIWLSATCLALKQFIKSPSTITVCSSIIHFHLLDSFLSISLPFPLQPAFCQHKSLLPWTAIQGKCRLLTLPTSAQPSILNVNAAINFLSPWFNLCCSSFPSSAPSFSPFSNVGFLRQ